jgi:mannose-1-phosphate guanylyltransferase
VSKPDDPTPIRVIQADIGWNDVGHWGALDEYAEQDEAGNVVEGHAVLVDASDNVIHGDSASIAVVGLDGIVVVQTEDAILVCAKDRAQDVRAVVDRLKKQGRKALL